MKIWLKKILFVIGSIFVLGAIVLFFLARKETPARITYGISYKDRKSVV